MGAHRASSAVHDAKQLQPNLRSRSAVQRQVQPLTAQVSRTHRHSTSERARDGLAALTSLPSSLTQHETACVFASAAEYFSL